MTIKTKFNEGDKVLTIDTNTMKVKDLRFPASAHGRAAARQTYPFMTGTRTPQVATTRTSASLPRQS